MIMIWEAPGNWNRLREQQFQGTHLMLTSVLMHKINPDIIWLRSWEQGKIQEREKVEESCRKKSSHELEAVKPLRGDRRAGSPSSWFRFGKLHSHAPVHVYPYSKPLSQDTLMGSLFITTEVVPTTQWNGKDTASWFLLKLVLYLWKCFWVVSGETSMENVLCYMPSREITYCHLC